MKCYFKKFAEFTSCTVLEELSECLCLRSLGDCRCSCVYTAACSAACSTGLQESMDVPEQDREREGAPLRGTTFKCWMVGDKVSSQEKQHWMGQLLGAASKESKRQQKPLRRKVSVWVQPKLPCPVLSQIWEWCVLDAKRVQSYRLIPRLAFSPLLWVMVGLWSGSTKLLRYLTACIRFCTAVGSELGNLPCTMACRINVSTKATLARQQGRLLCPAQKLLCALPSVKINSVLICGSPVGAGRCM